MLPLGVRLQAETTTHGGQSDSKQNEATSLSLEKANRAAKLARQLAEVQALRKLVQKAEAGRLN
jgi:hypothetical protein